MKTLKFLLITLIVMHSCNSDTVSDHKTEKVQSCLDLFFAQHNKEFDFLEKCQLILIKDQFSSNLSSLHYGNNKIILKEVRRSEIKDYTDSPTQDISKVYIQFSYSIIDDRTVNIKMLLPNVNKLIYFILNKAGTTWHVRITKIVWAY